MALLLEVGEKLLSQLGGRLHAEILGRGRPVDRGPKDAVRLQSGRGHVSRISLRSPRGGGWEHRSAPNRPWLVTGSGARAGAAVVVAEIFREFLLSARRLFLPRLHRVLPLAAGTHG